MDIPKGRAERIEAAIAKGHQSICRAYKEKYLQAIEAYRGPHKTFEDFEKDIGKIDSLADEVHGVSDSCLNNVDIALMVLYHGIRSMKEQKIINEKRKEMKNQPLKVLTLEDVYVTEAIKFITEAKERKSLNEQAVDYYIGNSG